MRNVMSWIKSFSLVLFSLLVAIAGAEIFLRLVTEEKSISHSTRFNTELELHDHEHHFCYGPKDRMRFDPKLISLEHPNQQYFEFRNDGVALHTYNQYGYRITVRKPTGPNNVIVLGDSFVRGTLADDTETIPSFLTIWSTDGRVYFNLGVGGHGPSQHLINYKRNAGVYQHDLVILFHYLGNDSQNEFDFATDLKTATDNYSRSESDVIEQNVFKEYLKNHLLKYRVGQLLINAKRNLQHTFFIEKTLTSPNELATLIKSPIEELVELATTTSKQVLLVTIPSREVYDDVNYPENQVTYQKNSMMAQKKIINEIALSHRLKVLHIDEFFQVSAERPIEYYGFPDAHLNEKGYHLVAIAVSKFLTEQFGFEFTVESNFVNRTLFSPRNARCPDKHE
jgi:hypothetical protein